MSWNLDSYGPSSPASGVPDRAHNVQLDLTTTPLGGHCEAGTRWPAPAQPARSPSPEAGTGRDALITVPLEQHVSTALLEVKAPGGAVGAGAYDLLVDQQAGDGLPHVICTAS